MTVRSDRWHRNVAIAQLAAYLLIVLIGALAFLDSSRQAQEICDRAAENREATRNLVVAIDALGRQLVIGSNSNEGTPTAEQQAALDRFAEFRDAQLALLDDPVC